MRPWYCAQTEPNKEYHARQNLEQLGIPAFLPTYLVKDVQRHLYPKRLFPNYVFFSLDDPILWPRLKTIEGILRVITNHPDSKDGYMMPSNVASEQINRLKALCLSYDEFVRKPGVKPRVQTYITEGCHVRILNGPFGAFSVQKPIVQWIEEDRAGLLLALFGKEMKVEFYLKDLEKVEG